MEQLLKSVTEAEAQAAEKKAAAQAQAAEIVSAAHAKASAALKQAEESLKVYRESAVREAEAKAAEKAKKQLEEKSAEEKGNADALLVDTKSIVSQIVRRVVDGDSRHA